MTTVVPSTGGLTCESTDGLPQMMEQETSPLWRFHPDLINVSRRCVLPVGKQPNDSSAETKSRVAGRGHMI
jgi:hypothetical protein